MATNNNKPTHTLQCGNIKATIWQNAGENGLRNDLLAAIQGSVRRMAQRDVFRSPRPRGPHERRAGSQRLDRGSRLDALSPFTGKPPALRGLPSQLTPFASTIYLCVT